MSSPSTTPCIQNRGRWPCRLYTRPHTLHTNRGRCPCRLYTRPHTLHTNRGRYSGSTSCPTPCIQIEAVTQAPHQAPHPAYKQWPLPMQSLPRLHTCIQKEDFTVPLALYNTCMIGWREFIYSMRGEVKYYIDKSRILDGTPF